MPHHPQMPPINPTLRRLPTQLHTQVCTKSKQDPGTCLSFIFFLKDKRCNFLLKIPRIGLPLTNKTTGKKKIEICLVQPCQRAVVVNDIGRPDQLPGERSMGGNGWYCSWVETGSTWWWLTALW